MVHIRSWEIVVDALRDSDSGMRDAVNASKHGVAVRTVRRWRRVYQHEQKARGQTHTTVPCPRCHEVSIDEAAYAELFGWYLGDGYLIEARRGVYTLSVFNDACYVELNLHIADLMRRVKPGGRPHIRRITGCLSTSVGWKHWPCLFPQHGPGRKHERVLGMADWQWTIVRDHPADFLRGLFHSDGCRVRNWASRPVAGELKRYDYPRWQFTNHSSEIRGWCCQALDLVGVPWRASNWKTSSVSTRAGVARLDELIGLKS